MSQIAILERAMNSQNENASSGLHPLFMFPLGGINHYEIIQSPSHSLTKPTIRLDPTRRFFRFTKYEYDFSVEQSMQLR